MKTYIPRLASFTVSAILLASCASSGPQKPETPPVQGSIKPLAELAQYRAMPVSAPLPVSAKTFSAQFFTSVMPRKTSIDYIFDSTGSLVQKTVIRTPQNNYTFYKFRSADPQLPVVALERRRINMVPQKIFSDLSGNFDIDTTGGEKSIYYGYSPNVVIPNSQMKKGYFEEFVKYGKIYSISAKPVTGEAVNDGRYALDFFVSENYLKKHSGSVRDKMDNSSNETFRSLMDISDGESLAIVSRSSVAGSSRMEYVFIQGKSSSAKK